MVFNIKWCLSVSFCSIKAVDIRVLADELTTLSSKVDLSTGDGLVSYYDMDFMRS